MKLLSIRSFPRAILHLDADSFFASVETSKNPKLKGKPVVTGHERGIATSMSTEAKKLGITRGMPVFRIKREFPTAVIVHSDYEAYAMYSNRMFEIVRRYTDMVEEYSIDECFADLTGFRRVNKMSYEQILRRIQDDIEKELNISVSLGCGPTKVLAKVGSKWSKPHGITMIPGKIANEYLYKIPIENIWGIGESSSALLKAKGIYTAYDFAIISQAKILSFAHKPLIDIWNELNCHSVLEFNTSLEENPKSISRTLSFTPPKTNSDEIFSQLARNIENACIRAREYKLAPKSISWFLKTQEFKFENFKIKLDRPTNIPMIIIDKIREQFKNVRISGKRYRATGVTLHNLCNEGIVQNNLFNDAKDIKDREKIFQAVDSLNDKYGRHTVQLAISMKAHTENETQKEGRIQMSFFDKVKKTGRDLCIPYLGETI
jgi:DNA polymerase-4/DNA polymerase V